MKVTDEMLAAAMKKAVELGLVPKAMESDAYLKTWDAMRACLQAAIDAQSERKMTNLRFFFPKSTVIEAARPGQVAGALLKVLITLGGPDGCLAFSLHNVLRDIRHQYDGRWECARAAAEAWAWLSAREFIVPSPERDVGWHILSRAGLEAARSDDVEAWSSDRELPDDMLHPTIVTESMDSFRQGKFDTAVFEAFRALEIAVRHAAGLGPDMLGTKLMAKAFNTSDGILADRTAEAGEQVALMNLMTGAIGSYKNPTSHRHVGLAPQEAREMIIIASHLLRIVDSRSSK